MKQDYKNIRDSAYELEQMKIMAEIDLNKAKEVLMMLRDEYFEDVIIDGDNREKLMWNIEVNYERISTLLAVVIDYIFQIKEIQKNGDENFYELFNFILNCKESEDK